MLSTSFGLWWPVDRPPGLLTVMKSRLLRGVDRAHGLAPAHRGGQEVAVATVGSPVGERVRIQIDDARQRRSAGVPRAGATDQGDGLGGSGRVCAVATGKDLERHCTRGRGATASRVLRDDRLV